MSDLFQWDKAVYGLNVPEMDREHETLIGLMNRLFDLHAQHASRAQLSSAVDALVNFTVKHFADEEAYMASIGSPDLKTHAGVHKQLLRNVTEHVQKFQQSGALTDEFFSFLTFWLKAHIRGVDARYAKKSAAA